MSSIAIDLPYPFELGFMQRALLASMCVGVFAPLIGTFLVQKRLSLIGDGIGHIAFAGIGAGALLATSELWTALAFAVAGALGVEWLRRRRLASGDVALAILFYSGIALGVVLLSLADALDAQVLGLLFGAPLTVTAGDVLAIAALAVGVVALVVALRRPLFSVVTDDAWSRVAGLPVDGLNALLAVVTAVAVVAAMRIVGILLVAAMMVLPVATAQLLARSFAGTLRLAIAVGAATSVAGLAASRIWGLAPGGTIVLLAAGTFAIASVARRAVARSPVRTQA
jgi:zinc transport system permease protein